MSSYSRDQIIFYVSSGKTFVDGDATEAWLITKLAKRTGYRLLLARDFNDIINFIYRADKFVNRSRIIKNVGLNLFINKYPYSNSIGCHLGAERVDYNINDFFSVTLEKGVWL